MWTLMLAGAALAAETTWIDLDVLSSDVDDFHLRMPYPWVDAVMGDALDARLAPYRAAVDDLAARVAAEGAGAVAETHLPWADGIVRVRMERTEATARAGRTLVVSAAPDQQAPYELSLPFFAARMIAPRVSGTEIVGAGISGPISAFVDLPATVARLGDVEPFTLLEAVGAGGSLTVATR